MILDSLKIYPHEVGDCAALEEKLRVLQRTSNYDLALEVCQCLLTSGGSWEIVWNYAQTLLDFSQPCPIEGRFPRPIFAGRAANVFRLLAPLSQGFFLSGAFPLHGKRILEKYLECLQNCIGPHWFFSFKESVEMLLPETKIFGVPIWQAIHNGEAGYFDFSVCWLKTLVVVTPGDSSSIISVHFNGQISCDKECPDLPRVNFLKGIQAGQI